MSKDLETKLDEITFCHGCKYEYAPKEECPCVLIKKELKAYEELEEQLPIINTYIRALEIIKKAFDSSSIYTNKLKDSLECGWITQEEYDLLREVLL